MTIVAQTKGEKIHPMCHTTAGNNATERPRGTGKVSNSPTKGGCTRPSTAYFASFPASSPLLLPRALDLAVLARLREVDAPATADEDGAELNGDKIDLTPVIPGPHAGVRRRSLDSSTGGPRLLSPFPLSGLNETAR